ncbi:MAG: DUF2914 domain-containing protein [Deltaproteobacteria bacterium]|nr:DUF2914 domain-containing protein [Deltaproteobacteria bacterium]
MKNLFLAVMFLLSAVSFSSAGEPTVEVATVATSVENLIPVGVSEKFSSSVGRLYCYSKILGGAGQNIKHLWYINGKKLGEATLSIKAGSYRTYSLVTILPGTKGIGRIDITTGDGKLLKSVEFLIE